MTRINSAIQVKLLTDEHLLAEHREIKRLPAYFVKALTSGALHRVPNTFCLGTGHVTFFLNKQKFIFDRYIQLYNECILRGFDVTDYSSNWLELKHTMEDNKCWNDYTATQLEKKLLIERISERIEQSSKTYFHYKKDALTKQKAILLLI